MINLVMMEGKKYYVVWRGHVPGVYGSWEECKEQIGGVQGALYKGFKSLEVAEQAFEGDPAEYIGKDVEKPPVDEDALRKAGRPVWESISVDAACSGNPGTLEYRGVETWTGRQLFHQGPFKEGTVNIGEFLALVHALALMKKKGVTLPVYTDSKTAIKWVKDKKTRTKLRKTPDNEVLFELLDRAVSWLQINDYPNEILKWKTEFWGEIPADFGRK